MNILHNQLSPNFSLGYIIVRKQTIIIQDGDLHDAGPPQLDVHTILSHHQGQLQEELFLWFPLVIINNCDSYLNIIKYIISVSFYIFPPLSLFHKVQK